MISRGFVNLVEVEFMPGGEVIGTDNWYQMPSGGYRDALVDCAPGGLYPYAADRGTPLPRTGILLSAVIKTPAVAHSGLTRLRRTGFPPEWTQSLFVAEHNSRKVVRHDLKRHGSTFTSTRNDFATSDHPDFHPSDVLEAPDGSLLVVDTGGWYVEHCPTGRIRDSRAPGGVYRVHWTKADDGRAASSRDMIFAEFAQKTTTELGAHLTESDTEMVTAALRALASRRAPGAADNFVPLLSSTNASVRRAAAEALAVVGRPSVAPALVEALQNAGDDFEQHACAAALLKTADEPFVRVLLTHVSSRVRAAAIQLLDQPPNSTLAFRDLIGPLGDGDARFRAVARGLLERHSNWATHAAPWLNAELGRRQTERELSVLRAIFIAFQSNSAVRDVVRSRLVSNDAVSLDIQRFILSILPAFAVQPLGPEWLGFVESCISNPQLRAAALEVAVAIPRSEFKPTLLKLSADATIPTSQRFLALRASSREPVISGDLFKLAIKALEPRADHQDRLSAMDLLARSALSSTQGLRLLDACDGNNAVMLDPLVPAIVRATREDARERLMQFLGARLNAGWIPTDTALQTLLAVFPENSPVRDAIRTAVEKETDYKIMHITEFKPWLKGGDSVRGREAFALATCNGCHRIGEQGGEVGPDLTQIGSIRSGNDLLESILFPSSSFAQGYEPYILEIRSGEQLYGNVLDRSGGGLRFRDGIGVVHHVRSEDVIRLSRLELSAMPAGLEQLLTREQFRDLLAYLQSLQ